ncbi:MAG: histidine--tRNA ligase [Chloroflexota bacterium]|nr:histidine--tRNA ligase [Chloroflexota bacterium]
MVRYTAPRGTQDILPEDQPYWRYVEEHLHAIAHLYGYERITPPIFEDTAIFERGVGQGTDIVEKEMYTFLDRGGSSITLRPEFTASVVRAYIEHGMHVQPQPVKLYSIGPAFRYERPQAGRYRQHHQFNVEAVGAQDPAVDLEVMSLAWQLYDELGFRDLAFQINSTGCPECRPDYIRVLKEYYAARLSLVCNDCRLRFERNPLRMLDCKVEGCQPLIDGAPHFLDYLCEECAEHFAALRGYLDELNRPYTLNHRLVRGLDYYTKTVFEVWAAGIGAQAAVCGGGRYDGLAEALGGPLTPGVGFASGIERIILTMKAQGVEVPPAPKPLALIATIGEKAKLAGITLVSDLRGAGIPVALAFGDRSLRSQMREAGKLEVAYTLILGADEVQARQVIVRDMAAASQESVAQGEIVAWLKARLA